MKLLVLTSRCGRGRRAQNRPAEPQVDKFSAFSNLAGNNSEETRAGPTALRALSCEPSVRQPCLLEAAVEAAAGMAGMVGGEVGEEEAEVAGTRCTPEAVAAGCRGATR